jgi:non-heme chloroperoxidase
MAKILFMIHGMWGGGYQWDNFKGFFEALGWRCEAPYLRHHDVRPEDPPHPSLGTTSLLDYAADLEAAVRALPERPVIVGHSMGGLLAQMLASRGLAEKLVLLAPASPRGITALTASVVKCFLPQFTTWGFWKRPNHPSLDQAVYAFLHLIPPAEQRPIHEKLVHESGRAAFEIGLWPLDGKRASEVDPAKITCPVLVVAAEEDRIVPAKVVRKVAARYPQAQYRELKGHAHWLIGEPGWEEVVGFVATWLERSGSRPGA